MAEVGETFNRTVILLRWWLQHVLLGAAFRKKLLTSGLFLCYTCVQVACFCAIHVCGCLVFSLVHWVLDWGV